MASGGGGGGGGNGKEGAARFQRRQGTGEHILFDERDEVCRRRNLQKRKKTKTTDIVVHLQLSSLEKTFLRYPSSFSLPASKLYRVEFNGRAKL
jgi:hypothetical protein